MARVPHKEPDSKCVTPRGARGKTGGMVYSEKKKKQIPTHSLIDEIPNIIKIPEWFFWGEYRCTNGKNDVALHWGSERTVKTCGARPGSARPSLQAVTPP